MLIFFPLPGQNIDRSSFAQYAHYFTISNNHISHIIKQVWAYHTENRFGRIIAKWNWNVTRSEKCCLNVFYHRAVRCDCEIKQPRPKRKKRNSQKSSEFCLSWQEMTMSCMLLHCPFSFLVRIGTEIRSLALIMSDSHQGYPVCPVPLISVLLWPEKSYHTLRFISKKRSKWAITANVTDSL